MFSVNRDRTCAYYARLRQFSRQFTVTHGYLENTARSVPASASTRGTQQEATGAGDAAVAGAVAAEFVSADASAANGGQEEGVGASPAVGDSAATTDTATADHAEAVSVAARAGPSRP